MRWDRLLAEIEASAMDDAALDRDALAAELSDEEWSGLSARDLIWGDVALEVQGAGWIEGHVVRAAGDLVVLTDGVREVVVARSAVLGWRGGAGRAPALHGVSARLGWSQLLRAVRDEGEALRVTRIDGSAVEGRPEAVTRDAFRIRSLDQLDHDPSSLWVALTSVATVRVL